MNPTSPMNPENPTHQQPAEQSSTAAPQPTRAPVGGSAYPAAPYPYPYPYPQPYASPYAYYPAYAWSPAPAPVPTPAERPSKPGVARVRNIILAATIVVVTLGAIALGAAGALTGQDAPSPTVGGFQRVYDSALNPGESASWALTAGCALESGGLHATAGAESGVGCAFQPSTQNDLLSQGFYLATTLAPAGQVAGQEAEAIDLAMPDGSLVELSFAQDGTYVLDVTQAGLRSSLVPSSSLLFHRTGVSIAWHADSYETNTVVVRYAADTQTLAAYVNGQSVATESLPIAVAEGASLSLGAPMNAEALITHVTLYSSTPATN